MVAEGLKSRPQESHCNNGSWPGQVPPSFEESEEVSRLPGCETCVVKDLRRRGTESQVESRAGAVDLSKIFGIRPVSENLFTLVK